MTVVNDELQVDIGSAQNVHSPKSLLTAHQTAERIGDLNKAKNIAIFDNLDFRNNFEDIGGQRYPRDPIITNYYENDFVYQHRDIKYFEEIILANNY